MRSNAAKDAQERGARPVEPSPESLPEALLRASAYPDPAGAVERIETHISWVFLTDRWVYKVKKPVCLEFLDFTDVAARQHFCEEEVRLNRRLAGDVYRGVVPIFRDAVGGFHVERGAGERVDFAVKMRRLPRAGMLDARLARAEVDNSDWNRLVDVLVRFHRAAAHGPAVAAHATPARIRELVEGNLLEVAALAEPMGLLSPARRRLLRWSLFATTRGRRELLQRRCDEERIREGHGDLHAGNLCEIEGEREHRSRVARDARGTPDGVDATADRARATDPRHDTGAPEDTRRWIAYDSIEFSEDFRCIDVAAEVAFLAMDLDARGFRGFAGYLVHRYAERARDPAVASLASFYKLHYALVRAKVALILSAQARARAESAAMELARSRAERYVDLATGYALPPSLVITCGLPGAGKSTAARAVAEVLGARVLRSDVIRKRLAGAPLRRRAGGAIDRGIYDPAVSGRTYSEALRLAEDSLRAGRSVVVDAAFGAAARRAPFVALAARLRAPFACLYVDAPPEVVRQRLARRDSDRCEVSDADVAVYEAARDRFEPPDEVPGASRVRAFAREPVAAAHDVMEALTSATRHSGAHARSGSGERASGDGGAATGAAARVSG